MHCPSCRCEDTRVIDTRVIEDGATIRRRRQCPKCEFRFSTIEEIEILSLEVEKADEGTEPYDKEKLVRSLKIALRKRPVSPDRLKRIIHSIEQDIQTKASKDKIHSRDIGEIVMKYLKKLDKVAYIRFASVYRSFDAVEEFADEAKRLTPRKKKSIFKKKKK